MSESKVSERLEWLRGRKVTVRVCYASMDADTIDPDAAALAACLRPAPGDRFG